MSPVTWGISGPPLAMPQLQWTLQGSTAAAQEHRRCSEMGEVTCAPPWIDGSGWVGGSSVRRSTDLLVS